MPTYNKQHQQRIWVLWHKLHHTIKTKSFLTTSKVFFCIQWPLNVIIWIKESSEMCQLKYHFEWDLRHLAKTSTRVCRKPFEISLFKEFHFVQSRHIVLCKKAFFLHLHLPLLFFLQPHFISSWHASDVLGRSLSTKVQNFFLNVTRHYII